MKDNPASLPLWTVTTLVTIADQGIKFVVLAIVDLDTIRFVNLLPGHARLVMVWNEGVNFGLLSNDSELTRWILTGFALSIVVAIIWGIHKRPRARITGIFAGTLCGGAIGNAVDRILHGAVADYLNVTCCGIVNPYAFNFADMAIFTGLLGLVYCWDRQPR